MSNRIDQIDSAIIELLQEDGRMPCAAIARRLGNISERVVRLRINRLVQEGTIKVGAIVRPEALGFTVIADVWLEIEPGQVMSVAQRLAQFNEITYIACSTGEMDISMQVCARDNVRLYRFVTETISNLPGVKKSTMLIVPMVIKDVPDWRVPDLAQTEAA